LEHVLRRKQKCCKRSGARVLQGAAEGTGIVQFEKRRFGGDLMALYISLKGGCDEMGVNLFS